MVTRYPGLEGVLEIYVIPERGTVSTSVDIVLPKRLGSGSGLQRRREFGSGKSGDAREENF